MFGIAHVTNDWRLFLDGSSNSLKVVLLHNENTLPSVPLAYCKKLPEKYENMQQILNFIGYNTYGWEVIADYKLINILSGLMGAASKNPCAFCLWDAKYKGQDKFSKKDWPSRPQWSTNTTGKHIHNAIKPPLVPISKILFPPLHIKIGLVTQLFKKVYALNLKARKELSNLFPSLSQAKMKAGVYDGPQIRRMFASTNLADSLNAEPEQNNAFSEAFSALKDVCESFLGNRRSLNYLQVIENMMKCYEKLDINITIKMHTLICHLDIFKDSCGAYSDEQGERFHQDLKSNEQDYAGKDMAKALGRYCWTLIRETDPTLHKRQAKYGNKTQFFYVNKQ